MKRNHIFLIQFKLESTAAEIGFILSESIKSPSRMGSSHLSRLVLVTLLSNSVSFYEITLAHFGRTDTEHRPHVQEEMLIRESQC